MNIVHDELHIGFTGSREGMTGLQRRSLQQMLAVKAKENPSIQKFFHHGDCVGADYIAHKVAKTIGYTIVIHPPEDDKLRAHCESDIILSTKSYLNRNRDIVDMTHYTIAVPKTGTEELRSGTWATIRYARNEGKLWKVIKPTYIVSGFSISTNPKLRKI